MNIAALIGIALDTSGKQSMVTTISDLGLLYQDYEDFKVGTLKAKTLASTGKLVPMLQALARETALLATLAADPKEEAKIVEIATEAGL